MRVTIAWHELHDSLSCPARLAAELGYLIRVWEGSDCYGSYSTDILCMTSQVFEKLVLFVQRGWRWLPCAALCEWGIPVLTPRTLRGRPLRRGRFQATSRPPPVRSRLVSRSHGRGWWSCWTAACLPLSILIRGSQGQHTSALVTTIRFYGGEGVEILGLVAECCRHQRRSPLPRHEIAGALLIQSLRPRSQLISTLWTDVRFWSMRSAWTMHQPSPTFSIRLGRSRDVRRMGDSSQGYFSLSARCRQTC